MTFSDVLKGRKLKVDFTNLKPVPAGQGYVASVDVVQEHVSAKGNRSIRIIFSYLLQ